MASLAEDSVGRDYLIQSRIESQAPGGFRDTARALAQRFFDLIILDILKFSAPGFAQAQVLRFDVKSLGHQRRPFDHVLKLADIPGPAIA